jgi:hypothetical protein
MDLRRLRAGEWVAAASGVALLVSLFLPWYSPEICVARYADVLRAATCPSLSGWESLSAIDVLLAFAAATGVLLAIVTATQRVAAVPVALSALVALAGLAGVLLVLFRLVDIPEGAGGREWALWLGLAGAGGIAVGSVMAMRDEVRPRAQSPEIETIPAPGP